MTTLGELAEKTEAVLEGNPNHIIKGVASLMSADIDDLAFFIDAKERGKLKSTAAGAVVLSRDNAELYGGNRLVSENPYLTFARAAMILYPPENPPNEIHPSSVIADDAILEGEVYVGPNAVIEGGAVIHKGAGIGPGCFIGANVEIGEGSRLYANVTVQKDCRIGKRCILHSGVVIGGDGFGYAQDNAKWVKVPHLGTVIIEDDVEIGSNTTIDRGTLDDTVIRKGVKIDNLVQIAHNVDIGEDSAIAGCVGIAGSAVVGKRCALGGQVGLFGHIRLADDVHVAASSAVGKSIDKPGVYSALIKAQDIRSWQKNSIRIHQLDEIARRLRDLERRFGTLLGDKQN